MSATASVDVFAPIFGAHRGNGQLLPLLPAVNLWAQTDPMNARLWPRSREERLANAALQTAIGDIDNALALLNDDGPRYASASVNTSAEDARQSWGYEHNHAWRALEHIIGSARPRHLKAALVSAAALADELGVPALRGRAISTISSALDKEAFRVALRDLALGVLDLKRVNEAMSYSWQEPVATALARAARRDSYRVYKHLNIRTRARPRLREDVWCHIIESALMTSSPIAAAITTELRQLKP
jgi:hypothetical protein